MRYNRGWMWGIIVLSIATIYTYALAVETPAADEIQDHGWPRAFDTADYDVFLYQPQVDQWPDFGRITFRAAISIVKKGENDRAYGTVLINAATQISITDRLVQISDRKIEQVTFPDIPDADAEPMKVAIMAISPPDKALTISLDRIVAQLDVSQVKVRQTDVNLAPPKIIASEKPAVMVIFMGKPRFKPVAGSDLMFAINTNWDLFLAPGTSMYYLLNGKSWLVTDNLEKGQWIAAATLPEAFAKLPADDNWKDVRAAIPLVPAKDVPAVFVSHEPAELIVTEGALEFEPLPGTQLMLVANTDSDLFFNTAEKQYYVLAAGRWFKAGALAGPWTAASDSLPKDFKNIPEDSAAAGVLVSVPGTEAANEAVIMASIPQKAAVSRTGVTVDVTYDGSPQFKPIETTAVQYAYNSPFSVFLVEGKYYCCYNAVWFVSQQPTGPWAVCDAVPAAIYTIPSTSSQYNVTYVTVYEATPTTVVTGYTAGYTGQTVSATGAVMFGQGMLVGDAIDDDCDEYYHDDYYCYYHYYPCYVSYGCGAHYHGYYGDYVTGGGVYGPYGGAGHYAAYNPKTGVYSRGAAVYGPNGAAGYRAAYNPSTGNVGYRAGGSNVYGSWGRAGVTNGEDWVRGGYKSGPGGSVGAIQGSSGAGVIRRENQYGNGTTVARNQEGDIYAGKDGNVYKKTDGGWEQQSAANRTRSTLNADSARPQTNRMPVAPAPSTQQGRNMQQDVPGRTQNVRPTPAPVNRPSALTTPARQVPQQDVPGRTQNVRPTPAPVNRSSALITPARQAPQQAGNLQRDASARYRGETNVSRTQQFQRSGGSYQRSGGGGSRSGGGYRGGGGGRR